MSNLDAAIAASKAALDAMSPVARALHDSDQRRSWVRGMTGREPPRDVLADEVRRLREELAAREAAAFQRGLEAAAAHVETVREWRGQDYYCDSCKDGAIYPDREDVAAAIRALPVPEDKA